MLRNRAFTLVEILVVMAVISLLSSITFTSLNTARAKARDAVRINDLQELRKALALYYSDNGHYPSTSDTWLSAAGDGTTFVYSDDWITKDEAVKLVPKYMASLPNDPTYWAHLLTGVVGPAHPTDNMAYAYISNGTDYAIVARGTVETYENISEQFCMPQGNLYCSPTEKSFAIYTSKSYAGLHHSW